MTYKKRGEPGRLDKRNTVRKKKRWGLGRASHARGLSGGVSRDAGYRTWGEDWNILGVEGLNYGQALKIMDERWIEMEKFNRLTYGNDCPWVKINNKLELSISAENFVEKQRGISTAAAATIRQLEKGRNND